MVKINNQMNKFTIYLALLCLITMSAIVIQIRTIKSTNSSSMKVIASDELRNQIIKLKDEYDKTSKELEKTEKKLEKVRQKALQNDNSAASKEYSIKEYNNAIGFTNLSGQGISIVISTNKMDNTTKEFLDNIINELKNAGAEAISINGNRLVLTSVISAEANTIKINSEKMESPFEIEAIGDTSLLYGALIRPGGYIELLNSSGIKAEVTKQSNIKIEKYRGLINLDNLKVVS